MRRLILFVLVGPLLGLASALVPGLFTGVRISDVRELLMWTYIGGVGPALVAGLADGFLSKWLMPLYRAIATGAVGFAASAVLLTLLFGSNAALFGAVGVLPAMICSWLSGTRA